MILHSRPLFTNEFQNPRDFKPERGSAYFYGINSETRSEFALQLLESAEGVRFIELREAERFVLETDIEGHLRIPTRRRSAVEALVCAIDEDPIYLDITGLGHSSWAPLTRVLLEMGKNLRVVYLEPSAYTRNSSPRLGELYDLSEKIEGIEPMPLFASLDDRPDSDICFIPLLGFEGTRFAHMLEEVQPPQRKTFPIIGVPGFRPEYPFNAFLGNAGPLERSGAHRNIHFAKSNCPFSLFYALADIANSYPNDQLKLGLVGTKPHALGAILFAISRGAGVELIYDHVRRKPDRTTGIDRCLVYGVSEFLTDASGRRQLKATEGGLVLFSDVTSE